MGRDVVPVDPSQPAVGLKKTKARGWIRLDSSGQDTILDVDKYAIMHRVHIHARDLRILDPLLSYPSTILGRENAIVVNLEVPLFFFSHFIMWVSLFLFEYLRLCLDLCLCFCVGSILKLLLLRRRYVSEFDSCVLDSVLFFVFLWSEVLR